MYWRLLSSDPASTRDIVLADKPPISTETDRMDKGMLDQVSRSRARLASSLGLHPVCDSCYCIPGRCRASTTKAHRPSSERQKLVT
jgi:hypothetical protein